MPTVQNIQSRFVKVRLPTDKQKYPSIINRLQSVELEYSTKIYIDSIPQNRKISF